jgi:hypothetical protein
MGTDPEPETYPTVKVSWIPNADPKVPRSKDLSNADPNGDSFSEQIMRPAKAADVGIYTASGKLDDQSSVAQALREAEEKRSKKIRAGSGGSSNLTNPDNSPG